MEIVYGIVAFLAIALFIFFKSSNKTMDKDFDLFHSYVHFIEAQCDMSPYSVLAIEEYLKNNKHDILSSFYKMSKQDAAYTMPLHAVFIVRNVLKKASLTPGLPPDGEFDVKLDYQKAQMLMEEMISNPS